MSKIREVPLWRIDASRTESSARRAAQHADQGANGVGNRDGKVSLEEIDAYAADLKTMFLSNPALDWKQKVPYENELGALGAARRKVADPGSETLDRLRAATKPLEGVRDSAQVLWTIASGQFR